MAQQALLGLLLLYALQLPWRLLQARDLLAGQCLLAAYLLMLVALWQLLPLWSPGAWLLPVLYPYAWGGITAVLWLPVAVTVSRQGVQLRTATDPRLALCLTANLVSHLGLALGAWLAPGLLLDYLLSPSLVVCAWYAGYRLLLAAAPDTRHLSWPVLLLPAVLAPLLLRLSSTSLVLLQQLMARY